MKQWRLTIYIDAESEADAEELREEIVGAIEDAAESGNFAAEAVSGELELIRSHTPPMENR